MAQESRACSSASVRSAAVSSLPSRPQSFVVNDDVQSLADGMAQTAADESMDSDQTPPTRIGQSALTIKQLTPRVTLFEVPETRSKKRAAARSQHEHQQKKIKLDSEEFAVDGLLQQRRIDGQPYYLVRWAGHSDCTWEPWYMLDHLEAYRNIVASKNQPRPCVHGTRITRRNAGDACVAIAE